MAKEPKPPTVKERLAVVERVIAKDEREILREKDPFSLHPERKEDELLQEGEENDLRQALKSPEIRRVIYRVFRMGGLMDADGDPNSNVMAHHVGRRSLALDLYQAIKKVSPGAYFQMESEYESNLKSKEKKSDAT